MTSKITSKYQVTIPREIREKLHVRVNGAIEWRYVNGAVEVRNANSPIIELKNSINVGPGNIEQDIRTARKKKLSEKFGT